MATIGLPAARPWPRSAALETQLRVFRAVFWREIVEQRGLAGLGFLAGILEPIAHITVVCLWHNMVRVQPVYGDSKVLFVTTALYPIFMFIHLSSQPRAAIGRGGAPRRFPIQRALDDILARSLLKFLVYSFVGVILFTGVAAFFSPSGVPADPASAVAGVLTLALLGLGVGLCNAVAGRLLPVWLMLWTPVSRVLILFSGLLFIPAHLPENLRSVMKWNPVLQGVELFRHGFYPSYPKAVFMPGYLLAVVLAALVLGFCLERVMRRRLQAA